MANVRLKKVCGRPGGFTIVEVAAALVLLSIILSSAMVLMNRYVAAVIDMQLRQQAFELARTHMETLLSEPKLSDVSDYGTSDTNPDLEWETVVEPFYEPVTEQMWIRAVCSAGFIDSKGEYQSVELEHWITNLTADQVKRILAQQKVEDAYLELLQGGQVSEEQETTCVYLEQAGLDAEAYNKLISQQRRKKLEYIAQNGFEGYEQYLKQLEDEENAFLEKLGMNFDSYNEFAQTYVPQSDSSDLLPEMYGDTEESQPDAAKPGQSSFDGVDWNSIPPELVPLIEQMLGIKKTDAISK